MNREIYNLEILRIRKSIVSEHLYSPKNIIIGEYNHQIIYSLVNTTDYKRFLAMVQFLTLLCEQLQLAGFSFWRMTYSPAEFTSISGSSLWVSK
jgi:hypothetical protein